MDKPENRNMINMKYLLKAYQIHVHVQKQAPDNERLAGGGG